MRRFPRRKRERPWACLPATRRPSLRKSRAAHHNVQTKKDFLLEWNLLSRFATT